MKNVSIFVLINALLGGVLAASGAITAYADTLGPSGRWVSVVLGVLGVAQLVVANVIHAVNSPTTVVSSTPGVGTTTTTTSSGPAPPNVAPTPTVVK